MGEYLVYLACQHFGDLLELRFQLGMLDVLDEIAASCQLKQGDTLLDRAAGELLGGGADVVGEVDGLLVDEQVLELC